MNHRSAGWTVFALSCLLIAACKPRHEPVKPPVKPIVSAAVPAR